MIIKNNTLTSGQSNLTPGRIAATRGRVSRIRQVAPICMPYSIPQSASARYRCCPLLSHIEYIDRGHVRISTVRHLRF